MDVYGKDNALYSIPIGGEIAYMHLFGGYKEANGYRGRSVFCGTQCIALFWDRVLWITSDGGSNLDYAEVYLSLSGNNIHSNSYIGSFGVTLGYVVHSNQELKIAGKSIGGFSPLKNAFKIGFTWRL